MYYVQRTTKDKPELSRKAEKLLEDIDTGKVKMKKYTFDEHKEFVKKLLKD